MANINCIQSLQRLRLYIMLAVFSRGYASNSIHIIQVMYCGDVMLYMYKLTAAREKSRELLSEKLKIAHI